ncbi:hypothetical protein GTU73_08305 [Rathayibacter sp. VKM Ac-2804]|uniref:hypothetical protein n=1 Tax=Rathayibacter sp. VKM Ac-2804 TaxID=2609257 RepID=UPI00132E9D88|nr:hypothetical protein [Rathayibacter sp. VKM Ac-2804]QHF24011.1 hypothetical protein GTU73_08305 [Rathayibacter sp. VKM Ac-2804]
MTLWSLLVLLLLVPWLLRVVQRAVRRRRAADGSLEPAWAELLASARDLGIPVEDGESPRAQEALIAGALGDDEGARSVLRGLREGVERVRYAPVPAEQDAGWRAASTVVAGLRASVGTGARLTAAVAPRSVLPGLARTRRPRSDL